MDKSPFLKEIYSLPELIRESGAWLSSTSAQLTELVATADITQIILTGCGDSHHAAITTRLAFQQLTGLPCQALTAMELARYQAGQLRLVKTGRALVVGISTSGMVSRTVEALEMAKLAGATVLALTGNQRSALAAVAGNLFQVTDTQPLDHGKGVIVPGTRSYFLSLLALYHLAIQIGTARGHGLPARLLTAQSELISLADRAEQTIVTCEPSAARLIDEWSSADRFIFCGSGPNYGTALFSAAKMIEAAGDAAIGQDLEEWAHLQYFERQVDTPTVIISASEHDEDRTQEIITAAVTIGRRVALIAPESGSDPDETQPVHRLKVVGKVSEYFSPLMTTLPGMLLAAYRARALSEPSFRGFGGGRSRKGGGGISRIRSSSRIDSIID